MQPNQPVPHALRVRLLHIFYAITLMAFGLALRELFHPLLTVLVIAYWASVFYGTEQTRGVANLLMLLIIVGICVSLLLPTVRMPRESLRAAQCANNCREITLGLHNYFDSHGTFPPSIIRDENARPMHSWRVLILPYIGEQNLYAQYNFDEPWDGPHNRQLLKRCPPTFRCPSLGPPGERLHTDYFAVVGPRTVWGNSAGTSFSEITDGSFATAFIMEARDRQIPWTQPRDLTPGEAIEILAQQSQPPVARGHRHTTFFYETYLGHHVAFVDGAVRLLPQTLSPEVVRAILSKNGDEKVNWELLVDGRRQSTPRHGNWLLLTGAIIVVISPWPAACRKRRLEIGRDTLRQKPLA